MRAALAAALAAGADGLHAAGVSTVWVDVGTAGRTDLEANFLRDPSLHLIGIEPTPVYARALSEHLAGVAGDRFTMVQRACSSESGRNLTLYVHPMAECNTLQRTNPGSPDVHGGHCVGDRPRKLRVRSVALREVLGELPAALRVQLLKVDIQGHEWPCLAGALELLEKVDNIHLEVQDVYRNSSGMYEGQLTLGDMDRRLARRRFLRQYCEWNTPDFRELNCLYTRRGSTPLWITGRPQPGGLAVKFDLDAPPNFRDVTYVYEFLTSDLPGELADRLKGWGLAR